LSTRPGHTVRSSTSPTSPASVAAGADRDQAACGRADAGRGDRPARPVRNPIHADPRLTYYSARPPTSRGGGPTAVGYVELSQAPHSCSYEEGKFLLYAGLALLGQPATPGRGLWRADRCRVGLARRGSGICTLGWPEVPPGAGERLAAYDRRPPHCGAHRGQTVTDSHTPELPATSARNETGRVVPHYYSATHIWASTTDHWTLLPHRVVGGKRQYQMGHPGPSARQPAPLVAGRIYRRINQNSQRCSSVSTVTTKISSSLLLRLSPSNVLDFAKQAIGGVPYRSVTLAMGGTEGVARWPVM
jgi:hypothetical protein